MIHIDTMAWIFLYFISSLLLVFIRSIMRPIIGEDFIVSGNGLTITDLCFVVYNFPILSLLYTCYLLALGLEKIFSKIPNVVLLERDNMEKLIRKIKRVIKERS